MSPSIPSLARPAQGLDPRLDERRETPPTPGDAGAPEAASGAADPDPAYHPQWMQLGWRPGGSPDPQQAPIDAPEAKGGAAELASPRLESPEARGQLGLEMLLYKLAHAETKELDAELDQQLADLGPALTEAQRNAYVRAFHAKHADAYGREDAAAKALEDRINDPATRQAALQDPGTAAGVVEAVRLLAKSSHGQAALDWLAANFGSSQPGQAAAASAYAGLLDDAGIASIVEDAGASAASAALASGDPQAAVHATLESLQRLANAGAGGTAVSEGVRLFGAVADSAGRVDGAAQLRRAFSDAFDAEASPKLLAAAYAMAGALVVDGWISGVGSTPAERAKFLGDLAIAAQGGVERAGRLLSSGKNMFWSMTADITKTSFGAAGDAGKFLLRNAPILGGLASAFYIVADGAGLVDDPSVWKAGALAGDVMTLALLVPGLQVVGWIGVGVAALFSWIDASQEASERHQAELELLREIGVPDAAIALYDEHQDAVTSLASAGIDFERMVALQASHPEIFLRPENAEVFAQVVAAAGLSGDEVVQLADAMAGGPDGESVFSHLASDMRRDDGGRYSPAWVIGHLTSSDAFSGARAYLEQARPRLVQEAAARAAADSAYEAGNDAVMDERDFVYWLGKQDDPLYRAQFIRRSVEDGTLGIFVNQIAASGNAEGRQLLAGAIRDAYADGALSLQQANEYLRELGGTAIEPVLPSAPAPSGRAGLGQQRPV